MHFKKQITGAPAFKDMWCSWAGYGSSLGNTKVWKTYISVNGLGFVWIQNRKNFWKRIHSPPRVWLLDLYWSSYGNGTQFISDIFLKSVQSEAWLSTLLGNSKQCSLLSWTRGCGCSFPRPTDAPVKPNCCPRTDLTGGGPHLEPEGLLYARLLLLPVQS